MASTADVMALLAMADLSIAKGDYDRASVSLKGALSQVEKTNPGDIKQRLDIMMKLADVNHVTGQWVDALMYLDTVVHTASEKNMSNIMNDALLTSGSILSKKGKWDIAQRKFEQVMTLLGARTNNPQMAQAMVGIGIIYWRKGMGDEAVRQAKKALAIAEDLENDDILGSSHALIGSVAFDVGNYQQSLDSYQRSLEHFRRSKNNLEMSRILNNMGEIHKVLGDYPQAMTYFEGGIKATSGRGIKRAMAYLFANLAECHIRQGREMEARYFATLADENAEQIQDEYLKAKTEFAWALVHEHVGELGVASERYMSALLKMFTLGIPFDTGIMQLAYSKCLMKQGKDSEARKHLADAATSFRRAGSRSLAEATEDELAGIG